MAAAPVGKKQQSEQFSISQWQLTKFKFIIFHTHNINICNPLAQVHLQALCLLCVSQCVCVCVCAVRGADCVYPCHVGEEMQCNSLMCVYSALVGWPLITPLVT